MISACAPRTITLCLFILATTLLGAAQQTSLLRTSNLRQAPSTSSSIAETLDSGETVTLTSSRVRAGYYHVQAADGEVGWVWAKNVAVEATTMSAKVVPSSRATVSGAFQQSCSDPEYPSTDPTPIDSACGVMGSGGAETAQNGAKNQFCATGPPHNVTIQDLVDLQQKVELDKTIPFGNPRNHPLSDDPGPATDRTDLEALGEGTQVVLTGFVKIARQEGKESVNCGAKVPNQNVYHDIHISIVDDPNGAECSGVVAEMVPHHRPLSWTPQILNAVANSKLPVRLTGDMMFDSSHSPCANGNALPGDPSRVSLWEVHPIYKFEVCTEGDCSSGNGWIPLDSWQPQ